MAGQSAYVRCIGAHRPSRAIMKVFDNQRVALLARLARSLRQLLAAGRHELRHALFSWRDCHG
jgi:hypothetical protein